MPDETLKQVVDRVKAAKTAIGNAITAKGGTVSSGDGLEEYPADIATIPTGGITPAEPKDVNFYDYDGTCLYSYTADEFAELTEMPANPSHAGLTAQGWNWSLLGAKAYVSANGKLDIGQMYITSNGETRIYVEVNDYNSSLALELYLNANAELDVDWGDGSPHGLFTATSAKFVQQSHDYQSGNYTIKIRRVTGTYQLRTSYSYIASIISAGSSNDPNNRLCWAAVKRIELGDIESLGSDVFVSLSDLETITIPSSITVIPNRCFKNCYQLKFIAFSQGTTSIGAECMSGATALKNLSYPETTSMSLGGKDTTAQCLLLRKSTLPYLTEVTTGMFYNDRVLEMAILPNTVTNIGTNAFYYCSIMDVITIPDSVTAISASAFSNCLSLVFIKFTSTVPPTIANVNAWQNIRSDCYILVPLGTLDDYLNETNMPDDSTYLYLCYATYASGVTLPATDSDGYTLTWYATMDDARNDVNPITVGNGKEVYAVGA